MFASEFVNVILLLFSLYEALYGNNEAVIKSTKLNIS